MLVLGMVVNREVEIRQGSSGQPGEEIDIHVDAITRLPGGKYDRIAVIVEVKGCWNKDLMTAMQSQLRDRYLRDNASPFGLYLVGWFTCPQWDEEDPRRKATPGMTVEQARTTFEVQAASQSSSHVFIKALVLDATLR